MERKHAFDGIKVVDFGWLGVAPITARQFAWHGATVIRVECHKWPDPTRLANPFKDGQPGVDRAGFFATLNTNKYSISLDMTPPKGKEIAHRLIKWADIVIEGFQPGMMKGLGLDYDSASKTKPDIIYLSTSQQGMTGPHSRFQAAGPMSSSMAGFTSLTGWPDRDPSGGFAGITDFITPWYNVIGIIGALLYRKRTGKGMYIDTSQIEAGANFLAMPILDYTVNGRIWNGTGNQHPHAAPHGAFPCRGADRWCAIAVFSDEEWRAFCDVIGNPEWTRDPKFATSLARKKNEEELNKLVGEWTADFAAEEVVALMQTAGVSAGLVNKPQDLFEDPQLKHRQHFQFMEHPVIERHAYHAPAYRLSETPFEARMPAPCIGQHNEYVFKEIVGMSDDEIADLLAEGVITTDADLEEAMKG